MKNKKLASTSRFLLIFTLCFGVFCTLCSSCSTLGNAYMNTFEWLEFNADSFQRGELVLNGYGMGFFILGFSIVGILSLLAFIFALFAYRLKEIGIKPMIWAMLLFGVAVLVTVGSFTIQTQSSCYQNPEGSDDTVYCTYALPPGIILPFLNH